MINTVKQLKELLALHHDDDEVFVSNPSPENSVYTISPINSRIAVLMVLHKGDYASRIDIYTGAIYTNPINQEAPNVQTQ